MNYKVKLALVLVFGISIGFFESVVVVYLRNPYYPCWIEDVSELATFYFDMGYIISTN